jgi:hypothetical protein
MIEAERKSQLKEKKKAITKLTIQIALNSAKLMIAIAKNNFHKAVFLKAQIDVMKMQICAIKTQPLHDPDVAKEGSVVVIPDKKGFL